MIRLSALVGLMLITAPSGVIAAPDGEFKLASGAVRYSIASWGPDCGPKPVTERARSGGKYQLGSGLLKGRGRPLFVPGICSAATGLPGLIERRVGARFECASKPGAPKRVTGRIVLGSPDVNTVRVTTAFSYAWALKGSDCRLKASGSFTLNRTEPIEAPKVVETDACQSPGLLATLVAKRPRRRVRAGGRTRLKLIGKDASGCVVPVGAISWSPSAGTMKRNVWRAAGLEPGQRAQITAKSGALEATFTIKVVAASTPGADEDPLDLAAADPTDAEGAAAVNVAPQQTSAATVAASGHPDSPADTDDNTILVLAFAGFCTLAVGLVGVILIRARNERRAIDRAAQARSKLRQIADLGPTPAPVALPPVTLPTCSSCGRSFEVDTAFCPFDGLRLTSDPAGASTSTPQPSARPGQLCPKCGAQYGPDIEFCGVDGSRLVRVG